MNNYAHYHNRSKVLIKQSGKTVLRKNGVVTRRLIKTMGRRRLRVLKALGA